MTILLKSDFETGWLEQLTAALPDHQVLPYGSDFDPADITYAVMWKPPAGLLAGLPALKVIFSVGAGVDHLASDPQLPRDVPVVRMVDPTLTTGMAEYVTWAVLHLHRNAFGYMRGQQAKSWAPDDLIPPLASARTVGILGLGVLGSACASMLQAIGFNVTGWSRSPKTVAGVKSFSGEDGLAAFLGSADTVVNLLPSTAETRHIINALTLAHCRPGAGFVNAGRGATVDETALVAALDAGQLSGAVLDVFETEPLPQGSPLWNRADVLISPHVASVTSPHSASRVIAGAIRDFEAGKPLSNVVDWDKGY